jgi:hypothetical protein
MSSHRLLATASARPTDGGNRDTVPGCMQIRLCAAAAVLPLVRNEHPWKKAVAGQPWCPSCREVILLRAGGAVPPRPT